MPSACAAGRRRLRAWPFVEFAPAGVSGNTVPHQGLEMLARHSMACGMVESHCRGPHSP